MKVHFLSAYEAHDGGVLLGQLRGAKSSGVFSVVESAGEADLVVFAEIYHGLDPYFFDVIRHPVFRQFPEKSVLYHVSDSCETLCRTISPSVEKTQGNLPCRLSFPYLVRVHDNPLVHENWDRARLPKYLFSFVGGVQTHPVRQRILALRHPEALLRASSGDVTHITDSAERDAIHRQYIEAVLDSSFVLCPRGLGPTSMRLFEVMELGRVPVVIADSWRPILNLPWDEFAIFVAEKDVGKIPGLLEAARPRAAEMGRAARETWERHYAPNRIFDEFVGMAAELLQQPYGAKERLRDCLPLLRPKHWRNVAGYAKRALRPSRAVEA